MDISKHSGGKKRKFNAINDTPFLEIIHQTSLAQLNCSIRTNREGEKLHVVNKSGSFTLKLRSNNNLNLKNNTVKVELIYNDADDLITAPNVLMNNTNKLSPFEFSTIIENSSNAVVVVKIHTLSSQHQGQFFRLRIDVDQHFAFSEPIRVISKKRHALRIAQRTHSTHEEPEIQQNSNPHANLKHSKTSPISKSNTSPSLKNSYLNQKSPSSSGSEDIANFSPDVSAEKPNPVIEHSNIEPMLEGISKILQSLSNVQEQNAKLLTLLACDDKNSNSSNPPHPSNLSNLSDPSPCTLESAFLTFASHITTLPQNERPSKLRKLVESTVNLPADVSDSLISLLQLSENQMRQPEQGNSDVTLDVTSLDDVGLLINQDFANEFP